MRKIETFPEGKPARKLVKGENGGVGWKIVLDEEQKEWMRKWYPVIENSKLMEASGMSHGTLHRLAREMGLTKSSRGLAAIKRRQAAHIRKICTKNGYYDSIRGETDEQGMQGWSGKNVAGDKRWKERPSHCRAKAQKPKGIQQEDAAEEPRTKGTLPKGGNEDKVRTPAQD